MILRIATIGANMPPRFSMGTLPYRINLLACKWLWQCVGTALFLAG